MFVRSVAAVFAGGFAIGLLLLMMLPTEGAGQALFFAKARIADPPPVPCSKQKWPNMDRVCLSWTKPR